MIFYANAAIGRNYANLKINSRHLVIRVIRVLIIHRFLGFDIGNENLC